MTGISLLCLSLASLSRLPGILSERNFKDAVFGAMCGVLIGCLLVVLVKKRNGRRRSATENGSRTPP
jgi:high-affinity Fe2+/Pb2+ permease